MLVFAFVVLMAFALFGLASELYDLEKRPTVNVTAGLVFFTIVMIAVELLAAWYFAVQVSSPYAVYAASLLTAFNTIGFIRSMYTLGQTVRTPLWWSRTVLVANLLITAGFIVGYVST